MSGLINVNTETFRDTLAKELNDELVRVSEPLIEQAIKDIEQQMRKRLAANLISFIESEFVVETFGQDIRITVRGQK